jgi:hypothetical protein
MATAGEINGASRRPDRGQETVWRDGRLWTIALALAATGTLAAPLMDRLTRNPDLSFVLWTPGLAGASVFAPQGIHTGGLASLAYLPVAFVVNIGVYGVAVFLLLFAVRRAVDSILPLIPVPGVEDLVPKPVFTRLSESLVGAVGRVLSAVANLLHR